jgi:hypothetical protein
MLNNTPDVTKYLNDIAQKNLPTVLVSGNNLIIDFNGQRAVIQIKSRSQRSERSIQSR